VAVAASEKAAGAEKPDIKVTRIGAAAGVLASNTQEIEDEFNPFYLNGSNQLAGHILRPPYETAKLERLTQENNALGACIEAMVVNVDGTGFKIEKETPDPDVDAHEKDDPVAQKLRSFFREPFPGQSFVSMRRDLRRDLERIGYGFLEVMRSLDGAIVFLRNTPARTFRIVKLDNPVPVEKTIERDGATLACTVLVRERRFVQLMAGRFLYFREFGASRDLHKETGAWATPENPVPADKRATELLYFQVGQDPNSPYGVPRWEGQIPSIMGSRAAEENNLVFLQSGGMPPAMIIVQGGSATEDARKALEQAFAPGHKHRAVIIEVPSSGGTLERETPVKVSVERFGGERTADPMFEKFDDACFGRILRSFRFSPLFIGKSADFNFATAYASYLAAEAQVFGPERKHFDEIISRKLLPALGGAGYVLTSAPIALKDVAQQVAALQLAATAPGVDPHSLVDNLNAAAGLSLQFSQDALDKQQKQGERDADGKPGGKPAAGQPLAKDEPRSSGALPDNESTVLRSMERDDAAALIARMDDLSEADQADMRQPLARRHLLDRPADSDDRAGSAGRPARFPRTHQEA
jgi:capsid portal protein